MLHPWELVRHTDHIYCHQCFLEDETRPIIMSPLPSSPSLSPSLPPPPPPPSPSLSPYYQDFEIMNHHTSEIQNREYQHQQNQWRVWDNEHREQFTIQYQHEVTSSSSSPSSSSSVAAATTTGVAAKGKSLMKGKAVTKGKSESKGEAVVEAALAEVDSALNEVVQAIADASQDEPIASSSTSISSTSSSSSSSSSSAAASSSSGYTDYYRMLEAQMSEEMQQYREILCRQIEINVALESMARKTRRQ